MNRFICVALVFLMAATPSFAFQMTVHSKNPNIPIVVINKPLGDAVPLKAITRPFNRLIPTKQGPDVFAFHWSYWDKVYGYAWLNVDKKGRGTVTFRYTNGVRWDAQDLWARLDFLDSNKRVLHSITSHSRVKTALFGNREVDQSFSVRKAPEWWRVVAALRFHFWHEEILPPKPAQVFRCNRGEYLSNGGFCLSKPGLVEGLLPDPWEMFR